MNNVQNKDQNIIYSIVLCTYNREKFLEQCVESLVNLNFPKDKYEVIVVDDGSTDSTMELLKKYPIRLIQHNTNKGIASARNTGLSVAKGKIYICFDDDCYADENWLRELDNVYKNYDYKNISGVSGLIKLQNNSIGLIEKYMDGIGYANPSPISYVTSESLFTRFYSYLKNMFSPHIQTNERIFEVGEIWGANCSFPIDILKSVKGWDEKLSGVEDTDLCNRINKEFKESKFICTKNAIIFHDHRLSFKNFLEKPYNRGKVILLFYLKNKKIPPIFPFPIIIASLALFSLFVGPWFFLFSLIFLPQIFYSWWLIEAVKKRKGVYLTFPYLQSSYELSSILGILKGCIIKI